MQYITCCNSEPEPRPTRARGYRFQRTGIMTKPRESGARLPQAAPAFNPCAVIPHFNHPDSLPHVCAAVRAHGLDCLVVDDGSAPVARAVALGLATPPAVRVVTLPANAGKGAAVHHGLQAAARLGYTHAIQIDADGQHDVATIPRLLSAARGQPGAVINGYAVYDDSVPRIRYYGRYLTHFWVWVNTLSFEIRDSMCGLRVYPVAATLALFERGRIGRRMEFDTDIIVRLYWAGLRVRNLPVAVRYPADGVSHFRLLHDNLRIAAMHTRHFFGMLIRLPWLLPRNLRRAWRERRPA